MTKEQKLKDTIDKQQKSISKLNDRVSALMDRMLTTEKELSTFKERVGKDINAIVKKVIKK